MSDNTPELYELSDEELLKMDLSKFDTVVEDTEVEDEEPLEELDEVDDSEESEADDESGTEFDEDEDFEEETDEDDESDTDEPDEPSNDTEPFDEDTQDDEDEEEDPEEEDNEDTKNYGQKELQEFYSTVTASFRANGKDIQISDPADIISLMQQGINYSQKMAKLKPSMGVLRTLEEHGLVDPDKISFLIDLHNKDPKAIAKLIKDSEIDVYEFDEDKANDYVPTNKVQEESPLQDVLNDLEGAPGFQDMLSTVTSDWDVAGRQAIVDKPGLLHILQEQKQAGLFDQVMAGIEHQRMLGKLKGMDSLEAYIEVETQIRNANQPEPIPDEPAAKKFTAPRPTKKKVSNNSKKRKAASPQTGNNVAEEEFNPLAVSDEELIEYMEQQSRF